ncbi:MAG TPA: NADP oxidoreductase [Pseudomonadales bacterium]|nr:NADP oxidoreductase [Pseudomonadales bacterium]
MTQNTTANKKLKLATCSLAGCFGCHMSFLDIDERLLQLIDLYQFDRSPLTDIEHCGPCDVGLIEGGLCNEENIQVLKEFRAHCKILVAVGACAIYGGVPALRNHFSVESCLQEAFLDGLNIVNPQIPNDPELPRLLPQVHPIHEAVKIDYFLPGCPPSADAFWELLSAIAAGREPDLPSAMARFD